MQRGLPVLLPQPLTEFPHLSELPAADRMLDVLLSFEIAHPQPIRAGVGLAEVEVCLKLLSTCSSESKLIIFRVFAGASAPV